MQTFLAFIDYGRCGVKPIGNDRWTRHKFIEEIVETCHQVVRAWTIDGDYIEDITDDIIDAVYLERERISLTDLQECLDTRRNQMDKLYLKLRMN